MRHFALAALLCASASIAADEKPATFTREQIEAFEERLEQMVQERERAAFAAGVQHQKQACPALI